jgi:hypothetical protein
MRSSCHAKFVAMLIRQRKRKTIRSTLFPLLVQEISIKRNHILFSQPVRRSKEREQVRKGTASMRTIKRPKRYVSLHAKCLIKLPDVTDTEVTRQLFTQFFSIKFNENPRAKFFSRRPTKFRVEISIPLLDKLRRCRAVRFVAYKSARPKFNFVGLKSLNDRNIPAAAKENGRNTGPTHRISTVPFAMT